MPLTCNNQCALVTRLPGFFFPSPSCCLVLRRGEVGGDAGVALRQFASLGGVQRSLGVQHVQEVGLPLLVKLIGKIPCLGVGGDGFHQCIPALLFLGVGNHAAFHILQRRQHGLLVDEQCLFLLRVLNFDVGLTMRPPENSGQVIEGPNDQTSLAQFPSP